MRPVICLALAAVFLVGGAPARAADARIISDEIALTLGADGTLRASETVTFEGGDLRRIFVLRRRLDDEHDRVFEVRGGAVRGDTVTLKGGPGRTTARLGYTVRGTIAQTRGGEELYWTAAGGWQAPVTQTRVTVDSDATVQDLNCFAGDLSSTVGCTQFFTNHTHTQAEFRQQNLLPGEYLTIVIGYPRGSTRAEPILHRRHTLATAFTVNTVTGGTLIGLLALLLGGLAALYTTRGRDTRVVSRKAAEGDHAPVEGTAFAPPDGVRPGQVGTLIDEQADVVDVTATIIDLAVRGYILIEELSRLDWRLRRLDRPTGDLLPYERVLHDALFHGRDTVKLSELGGTFAQQLAAVRGALYEDVVRQGWFARRPDSERTRWTTAGMALTAAGVLGTVALAVFTELALIGLALIIAGAALAVGGQYMPAKTGRGAVVLAHTLGFRTYMFRTERPDAPTEDRVRLFSRYLPYAVVFDAVSRWAETVADIGDGGPADNLYWYEGPAEWDLSDFAESMRSFTLATSGAISASRQFRSLS
jgi:hypothetical protein